MASLTPLKELEENFFLCSICLDQFNEPKQLPCLHRYCTDCLNATIQGNNTGTIQCPMCKQDCVVPENGVDGFKTDFHTKSVLEFIQLQKSIETEDFQICVSCLKQTKVSAYCFKCRDFLCDKCYKVHITSRMFTDHRKHILKLENMDAKNLSLEKLSGLTENPRCHGHVNERAQLCCSSCHNVPVCVACTYGDHKGHDLHDVTKVAQMERILLTSQLGEVNRLKCKLYKLTEKIEVTMQQLNSNSKRKLTLLNDQFKEQSDKIKRKRDENKCFTDERLAYLQGKHECEELQTNLSYIAELDELNTKYEALRKKSNDRYYEACEKLKGNCDKTDEEFLRRLKRLERDVKSFTTVTELRREQNKEKLKETSDYCDQIIKRYKNFTATASSILTAKDDWTDVQCIPDIRAAYKPLVEEMTKELPELEALGDIFVPCITKTVEDDVTMSEIDTVVDVEGVNANGWLISGMTSFKDGNIVITGKSSNEHSHITVINRKGEIQRQNQVKREMKHHLYPFRDCSFLSEFKVVTVCIPDEIGLYNIYDGSYRKRKISDLIWKWSSDRRVFCVATDPANKNVIVGTNSREVYVFDAYLNYSHTITLPDEILGTNDIAVHRGNLLICDYHGKSSHAITVTGFKGMLLYKLTMPEDDDDDIWKPYSVCTDRRGYIYMLWTDEFTGGQRILVQYSQNGRQLLKRIVDQDAFYVTTLEKDESDKLLIATLKSGKIYEYDLIGT